MKNMTLEINDFGKIKHKQLRIKPLTIIAGKNDTGKSFTTRGLYSILSALNMDHLTNALISLKEKANDLLGLLIEDDFSEFPDEQSTLIEIKDCLLNLEPVISKLKNYSINEQLSIKFENDIKHCQNNLKELMENARGVKGINYSAFFILEDVDNTLTKIQEFFMDLTSQLVDDIENHLKENFTKNFQTTLVKLKNCTSESSPHFKLSPIANEIKFEENGFKFSINMDGIRTIQGLKNIIYLDSPIFTKIQDALEKVTKSNAVRRYRNDRDLLKGYPKYVDDMYNLLSEKYNEEKDNLELIEKVENIIGGKVELDANSKIVFTNNNDFTMPIAQAAMGIANIGTISLLLRENVITEGSFIILDEPEVHLHPEWQIKMMDILLELAKYNINVVIATHSIEMMRYLEYKMESDNSINDLISLNLMSDDKEEFTDDMSNDDKISIILEELTRPFFEYSSMILDITEIDKVNDKTL